MLATLLFSTAAIGDPIEIVTYPDSWDIPTTLGGHLTDEYEISGADGTPVSSFTTSSGNVIDLSPNVQIMTPWWVDDPNGDSIFAVPGNTVTLTPTNPLAAISFMIHSSYGSGGAWVSANWIDSNGNSGTVRNPESGYFPINQGRYDGVGVGISARPGACITSVTIDPYNWGFGSLRTADARPCVQVSEPGSLSVLGLGLLALGLVIARRRPRLA